MIARSLKKYLFGAGTVFASTAIYFLKYTLEILVFRDLKKKEKNNILIDAGKGKADKKKIISNTNAGNGNTNTKKIEILFFF